MGICVHFTHSPIYKWGSGVGEELHCNRDCKEGERDRWGGRADATGIVRPEELVPHGVYFSPRLRTIGLVLVESDEKDGGWGFLAGLPMSELPSPPEHMPPSRGAGSNSVTFQPAAAFPAAANVRAAETADMIAPGVEPVQCAAVVQGWGKG